MYRCSYGLANLKGSVGIRSEACYPLSLLTHELFKTALRNQDHWIKHSTQVEEESSTTCSSATKLLLELLKRMASVELTNDPLLYCYNINYLQQTL